MTILRAAFFFFLFLFKILKKYYALWPNFHKRYALDVLVTRQTDVRTCEIKKEDLEKLIARVG